MTLERAGPSTSWRFVPFSTSPPRVAFFQVQDERSTACRPRVLGLEADLLLSDDLSPLFLPARIANRQVGNRLAIQPMEGCDGEPDGTPGELTFRRFRRFGAGGAKLIWGEACAVVPEGRANPRQLLIDRATAPALERLVATTRRAHVEANGPDDELLVGLQLTHSGRYSYQRPILAQHDPLLDPRTVVDKSTGATAGPEFRRSPTTSSTGSRIVYRGRRDRRTRSALISSTSSSATAICSTSCSPPERGPGKYGGSFENRTRFIRESSPASGTMIPV